MPGSRNGLLLLAVIGLPKVCTALGAQMGLEQAPQSGGASSDLRRWTGALTVLGSCMAPAPEVREF